MNSSNPAVSDSVFNCSLSLSPFPIISWFHLPIDKKACLSSLCHSLTVLLFSYLHYSIPFGQDPKLKHQNVARWFCRPTQVPERPQEENGSNARHGRTLGYNAQ